MRTVLAVGLPLLVIACKGAEECTSWAGSSDMGMTSFASCGDNRTRRVDCDVKAVRDAPPGTPAKCTCNLDGVVGKKFEMTALGKLNNKETAAVIANEQCGWHLK